MRLKILTVCTALLVFISCSNDKTKSESKEESTKDQKKEDAWVAVDSATAMKAWMEYATPGAQHQMMAKSVGTWNGETTMWMSADAPAMKSTGTATSKMVMDGRYQTSEFSGDMMGMPFTGMAIMGYDNYKKVFVSTWIDNMGTGIMKMEGPWDEATKTMTLKGKYTDPATGRECEMREVFKIVDDNTQLMEMYGPDPKTGKEYKTMEVKYTRTS